MKMAGRPGPSIKALAERLGVTPERVRRAFYAWCDQHGYNPQDFYILLGPRSGRYELPDKFVRHMEHFVKREKRIVIIGGKKYIEEGGKLKLVGSLSSASASSGGSTAPQVH